MGPVRLNGQRVCLKRSCQKAGGRARRRAVCAATAIATARAARRVPEDDSKNAGGAGAAKGGGLHFKSAVVAHSYTAPSWWPHTRTARSTTVFTLRRASSSLAAACRVHRPGALKTMPSGTTSSMARPAAGGPLVVNFNFHLIQKIGCSHSLFACSTASILRRPCLVPHPGCLPAATTLIIIPTPFPLL